MQINPYVQLAAGGSTLDNLERLFGYVEPSRALLCFAYATTSGCTEFDRRFGSQFWNSVSSDWLVGFDYGRTQPTAVEFVSAKSNTRVRVYDGAFVSERAGFLPRKDFHMKSCVLLNEQDHRYGLLAGSGNLSRNGLLDSLECGITLGARSDIEFQRRIGPSFQILSQIWDGSDDLDDVIDTYKATWTPGNVGFRQQPRPSPGKFSRFWIEVGYVTRNRGGREGNQFDMPRGVHSFFGLSATPNQQRNTTIGSVTFVGNGASITRALRLGNNLMEKITLPFPESYDFGTYDGKVLEFERRRGGFAVSAYELEEFERLLQASHPRRTYKMSSGRTFGFR